MMQHEARVEGRVVEIRHVPIAADNAMYDIVQGLEAVGAPSVVHPGFRAELGEIVGVDEEIVESVAEGDAVVVEDWVERAVLTGSVRLPARGKTLGLVPGGELNDVSRG